MTQLGGSVILDPLSMKTLRFKLAYLRRWLRFYLGAMAILAILSVPAQAQQNQCSNDWQYVGYGIIAYSQQPSIEGKEQLLHELLAGLRRAERDCGD